MKFKLKPDYFTERDPIVIYRKNSTLFFLLAYEVAKNTGYREHTFYEFDKINYTTENEIGLTVIKHLTRFHKIGDYTISEYENMLSECRGEFLSEKTCNQLVFLEAKNWNDVDINYDKCIIEYDIPTDSYSFKLGCYDGRHKYTYYSKSTGETCTITFDTPLEFTGYPNPDKLGKMVMEALERSRKIINKAIGNPYPEKNIELANGSKLKVSSPRDKHFTDNDDYGVGELYQAYMYFPRESSEEASAVFYIGMASELDGELTEENVLKVWEMQYGKAEVYTFEKVEYGMFRYRAEMKNKKIHRIAYLTYLEMTKDSISPDTLDCTMELRKPNSRKKLDEKLTGLFEEFAHQCKFKD